jgi:ADP-ribose pyrophosphatase YjhB (NUDIX family)
MMRRKYPESPIAAVGAVVLDGGSVLLVRRGQEPQKGEWSIPGGAVELGETLEQAVRREVLEETGLLVEPVRVVEVLDRIVRDADGRVAFHYVLIDYVCRVTGGTLCCASDADEARWVGVEDLGGLGVATRTVEVILKACSI